VRRVTREQEPELPKHYRALISMPITAENDDEALDRAGAYASSLLLPGGKTIGGHVERLAEVAPGSLETKRVVIEEEGFMTQLL
jgi:hypothetical protein